MDEEKSWATCYGACDSFQVGKFMEKSVMSYGVHLSHKVVWKLRQYQMVHFVFQMILGMEN